MKSIYICFKSGFPRSDHASRPSVPFDTGFVPPPIQKAAHSIRGSGSEAQQHRSWFDLPLTGIAGRKRF